MSESEIALKLTQQLIEQGLFAPSVKRASAHLNGSKQVAVEVAEIYKTILGVIKGESQSES